jgi:hypothetical protein
MKLKKAQTAIEFLIIVIVFLFLLLGFLLAIQNNVSEESKKRIAQEFQSVAFIVQDEVNLALESRDGYIRSFEIPNKIGSRDINVSIIDGSVHVDSDDGEFEVALPVEDVSGQPRPGTNLIKKNESGVFLN